MINKQSLIFDLHCDTPHNIDKNKFNHIIPDNLVQEDYLGLIFAHFVYPKERYPFVEAVKLLSSTIAYISKRRKMHIVGSYKELDRDRLNVVLGVEGGHIFDNSFEQVEVLYNLGVRVFTLTWNNSNKLAHAALEADNKGLTRKGRRFLKDLQNYDVIIDLSHASTRTVLDVCDACGNQVIASHSCLRAFNPSFLRNIDDSAIRAIAQRGGVVGINFSRYHLGGHSVVDHIEYLKNNVGLTYAAIGSDFDGINDAVIPSPKNMGELTKEFLERGYKQTEINKILSGNFLRVFKNSSR